MKLQNSKENNFHKSAICCPFFIPLNGVKVREIHTFLLQHMNSFLVLVQIVFSAYYNQVRNANSGLQLLSLILNVSIISVISIPSAWMLHRNTSKNKKSSGSPWMKEDEVV